MKRFRWSCLYPIAWRKKYGDEFDAMLEMYDVTGWAAADIVWQAILVRCSIALQGLPLGLAWVLVSWLNIVAKEVQWPAGALMVLAFALTVWRRERWLRMTLFLFCAIPISSLYFYQIPHVHHEPLYKTSVALIPAFIGAFIGLLVAPRNPTTNTRADR